MKKKKRSKGFTLIEIMIVIVLVGILAGLTAPVIFTSINIWSYVVERREAVSSAQMGMKRIIREIRQIRQDEDMLDILNATSTRFRFSIDINGVATEIDYQLSADTVTRNGYELVSGVIANTGLRFTYYDENNNITALTSQIRRVEVHMIFTPGSGVFELESGVAIRNF